MGKRRAHALQTATKHMKTEIQKFRKKWTDVPTLEVHPGDIFDTAALKITPQCIESVDVQVDEQTTLGCASVAQVRSFHYNCIDIGKQFVAAMVQAIVQSKTPPSHQSTTSDASLFSSSSSSSTSTKSTTKTSSSSSSSSSQPKNSMTSVRRIETYAEMFWEDILNMYIIALASGPTGEPDSVVDISTHGKQVLYYISGWMVKGVMITKGVDPIIAGILEMNFIDQEEANYQKLPTGCLERRRPQGGGYYISSLLFKFYIELETLCRGFAAPNVIRRLRQTYGSDVFLYCTTKAEQLYDCSHRLVLHYRKINPYDPSEKTNKKNRKRRKRVSKEEAKTDAKKYAKLLLNILVKKYMPLRTEEALKWLMEDIGLRKSDGGAIRTILMCNVKQEHEKEV